MVRTAQRTSQQRVTSARQVSLPGPPWATSRPGPPYSWSSLSSIPRSGSAPRPPVRGGVDRDRRCRLVVDLVVARPRQHRDAGHVVDRGVHPVHEADPVVPPEPLHAPRGSDRRHDHVVTLGPDRAHAVGLGRSHDRRGLALARQRSVRGGVRRRRRHRRREGEDREDDQVRSTHQGGTLGPLTADGDLGKAVVTAPCSSVGAVATWASDEPVGLTLCRAPEDVRSAAAERDLSLGFHGGATKQEVAGRTHGEGRGRHQPPLAPAPRRPSRRCDPPRRRRTRASSNPRPRGSRLPRRVLAPSRGHRSPPDARPPGSRQPSPGCHRDRWTPPHRRSW